MQLFTITPSGSAPGKTLRCPAFFDPRERWGIQLKPSPRPECVPLIAIVRRRAGPPSPLEPTLHHALLSLLPTEVNPVRAVKASMSASVAPDGRSSSGGRGTLRASCGYLHFTGR